MGINEDADEALRQARERRAQMAAEAAERFRVKHEPHAVANLAFLGMHLALLAVARTFVADDYDVEIVLSATVAGSQITLKSGRRECVFSLRLYEGAVEAKFCGEGFRTWPMAWKPPSTLDYSAHYQTAASLAKGALVFVVGSVAEPDPRLEREHAF